MKKLTLAAAAAIFIGASATAAMAQGAPAESGILDKLISLFGMLPDWLVAITSVVTAATAVTALTPSKADDRVLNAILKVLNFLAGNIGKNKNADAA